MPSVVRLAALVVIVSTTWVAQGQSKDCRKGTFSMPDAALLFAKPYNYLCLMSDGNRKIEPISITKGVFNPPALSPDGDAVAWGLLQAAPTGDTPAVFTLGLFNKSRGWSTQGAFADIGAAAFSPDGGRIAFAAERRETRSVIIFELATGQMVEVPGTSTVAKRARLSWSPDGKSLAVQVYQRDHNEIAVISLANTTLKTIGSGIDPVWSPSGELVAFSSEDRQKLFVAAADGSELREVRNLSGRIFGHRMFVYGVVWAPNSKQLLLNEMKGDGPSTDVMLLDLATGKTKRKIRNGLPVFGWVNSRR